MEATFYFKQKDVIDYCVYLPKTGFCSHACRLWAIYKEPPKCESSFPDYVGSYCKASDRDNWSKNYMLQFNAKLEFNVLKEESLSVLNQENLLSELKTMVSGSYLMYSFIGGPNHGHSVIVKVKASAYELFDPNKGEYTCTDINEVYSEFLSEIITTLKYEKCSLSAFINRLAYQQVNARWLPDSTRNTCGCCGSLITSSWGSSNKHHCRSCGDIICGKCYREITWRSPLNSNNTHDTNSKRTKICLSCVALMD